ncbi:MAG: hypothetical protein ACM31C_27670 [Acidobacteriota bacterium]
MKIVEPDVLEQWWHPGALPRWAVLVLAVATMTTVAVAHVGGYHYAAYVYSHSFWLRDGLALGLGAVAAAAWLPAWRISRAARVALVLPVAQLAAIAAGWTIWCAMFHRVEHGRQVGSLVRALPLHAVVAIAAIVTPLVARAIVGRRGRDWLHATVMLALVHALLAGVWLSIAAQIWCRAKRAEYWSWAEIEQMLQSKRLIAFALAPPFIAAAAFTAIAMRWFERVRRVASTLASATSLAVIYAFALRADPRPDSNLVYVNFVHVLLALAVVAAGSLGALAAALWLRGRAGRDALAHAPLHGVVAIDSERGAPVACLQLAGWLRGPRIVARAFEVVTPEGTIVVPGDAGVVAELPAVSTRLAAGDAIAVVREGDRVALAGLVAPAGDHPFRASPVPVAGPRVLVGAEGREPPTFASVALALWRPCLAYLVVIVAIALPGLAAALSGR